LYFYSLSKKNLVFLRCVSLFDLLFCSLVVDIRLLHVAGVPSVSLVRNQSGAARPMAVGWRSPCTNVARLSRPHWPCLCSIFVHQSSESEKMLPLFAAPVSLSTCDRVHCSSLRLQFQRIIVQCYFKASCLSCISVDSFVFAGLLH